MGARVTDAGNEKCTGCPDPDDNNGETTLSVASTNADNCTCSDGFRKLCASNKCIRLVINTTIPYLNPHIYAETKSFKIFLTPQSLLCK
jgi:hypothetical protein